MAVKAGRIPSGWRGRGQVWMMCWCTGSRHSLLHSNSSLSELQHFLSACRETGAANRFAQLSDGVQPTGLKLGFGSGLQSLDSFGIVDMRSIEEELVGMLGSTMQIPCTRLSRFRLRPISPARSKRVKPSSQKKKARYVWWMRGSQSWSWVSRFNAVRDLVKVWMASGFEVKLCRWHPCVVKCSNNQRMSVPLQLWDVQFMLWSLCLPTFLDGAYLFIQYNCCNI